VYNVDGKPAKSESQKGTDYRLLGLMLTWGCSDPGVNWGPLDLQSNALPTELLDDSVATHFRFGGIFSDCFIANFWSVSTDNFLENWSIVNRVMTETRCPTILNHIVANAAVSTMI